MNLEFRHEIKGLWGYYETNERCGCFDDDVVNKALREFRKDKSSVLWVMDVSVEANGRNIRHVSMAWETWEDYDNKEVTMTFWKDFNDRGYHKFSWEKAKRIFRKVIGEAVKGDVVMSDIVKPQKVYR